VGMCNGGLVGGDFVLAILVIVANYGTYFGVWGAKHWRATGANEFSYDYTLFFGNSGRHPDHN